MRARACVCVCVCVCVFNSIHHFQVCLCARINVCVSRNRQNVLWVTGEHVKASKYVSGQFASSLKYGVMIDAIYKIVKSHLTSE